MTMEKNIHEKRFKEIKVMPEDYEIINCDNCFKEHDRINQNHYIVCGNTKKKEIYLLCITCGKIYKAKVNKFKEKKELNKGGKE